MMIVKTIRSSNCNEAASESTFTRLQLAYALCACVYLLIFYFFFISGMALSELSPADSAHASCSKMVHGHGTSVLFCSLAGCLGKRKLGLIMLERAHSIFGAPPKLSGGTKRAESRSSLKQRNERAEMHSKEPERREWFVCVCVCNLLIAASSPSSPIPRPPRNPYTTDDTRPTSDRNGFITGLPIPIPLASLTAVFK
jgi:hypothetical protein